MTKWKAVNVVLASLALLYAVRDNPKPNITEQAIVKEVYDGDTIVVTVTKEYRIRMLDCWAPEIKGIEKSEGLKSKEFLETMLKTGDEVLVEIPTTNRIQDSITFGRFLGYIWKDLDNDGAYDNISEQMVKNGFATKEKVKK
jgi:endonuclease YncB( thermonuclease family)